MANPSIPTASWPGPEYEAIPKPSSSDSPNFLGEREILEPAGTDYDYRLFVPKTAWMQVLAGLAEETDYDNFKSEVAHHQGRGGAAYERSLHEVWSVMNRLQK